MQIIAQVIVLHLFFVLRFMNQLLILLTKLTLASCFPGYRHVPVLNKRGDNISSASLFVHLMLLDAL